MSVLYKSSDTYDKVAGNFSNDYDSAKYIADYNKFTVDNVRTQIPNGHVFQYDGIVNFEISNSAQAAYWCYITITAADGVTVRNYLRYNHVHNTYCRTNILSPIVKGDTVSIDTNGYGTLWTVQAFWYKDRDYSDR